MSQSNIDQEQRAETRTQETRTFIRQVRAEARRKYTPEEKVRIVLEGFRREVTVSDLCRREGIKPGTFYAWTKEFMEAGKELAEELEKVMAAGEPVELTSDALDFLIQRRAEQIKHGPWVEGHYWPGRRFRFGK